MKVETILVCDDIRVEDTKKFILIGVYSENILVSEYSVPFNLSLWVQGYGDRNGEVTIEVRVLLNKKPIVRGEAVLIIKDYKEIVTMTFAAIPIRVEGDGMLTFQMREKDERWKTIKKLRVKKTKS